MTMSRRDTIMIAVLVNAAVLCVLFLLATHEDPVQVPKMDTYTAALSMVEEFPVKASIPVMQPRQTAAPIDEVDQALASYIAASPQTELVVAEPVEPSAASDGQQSFGMVEITVKRGDALEKIARANRTSVAELRRINGLANDKLSIGQVLKVPVAMSAVEKEEPAVAVVSGDGEYYTLQTGDSPWLIAKKFQVRLDDLLQLNGLDEAKARNLRPGDKVRVR